MEESDYIIDLFNDIKDNIEFDSDIEAIETLLTKMLDIDIEESFNNWKYIFLKYEISTLGKDIDFSPLLKDYPISLIKKVGYFSFFAFIENLSKENQKLIYDSIFNVFDKSSILYYTVLEFISKKDDKGENEFINYIISKSKMFSNEIFDTYKFIKEIISLHLENNYVPNFLQNLIKTINNKKEQAVLKTLLIDYIV